MCNTKCNGKPRVSLPRKHLLIDRLELELKLDSVYLYGYMQKRLPMPGGSVHKGETFNTMTNNILHYLIKT